MLGAKIVYEQEISVKSGGSGKVNVSNKVIVYKTDKYGLDKSAIELTDADNVIRGVFFGSLYAKMNPESGPSAGRDVVESGARRCGEDITHVVQRDDTLGSISAQFTGSTKHYRTLADINGIADPAALKVGQEIRIPKDIARCKRN